MLRLSELVKPVFSFAIVLFFSGCAQLETKDELSEQERAALQQEVADKAAEKAQFERALALHRTGELDAAKIEYKALIDKYPENVAGRINLAQINLGQLHGGNAEVEAEALSGLDALMDEALDIEPSNTQALAIAGVIARKDGRFEDSEGFYRKALSIDPNYYTAIVNLAILLDLYRGELVEALSLYEQAQALRSEPDPKLKDWIFDLKRRIEDA